MHFGYNPLSPYVKQLRSLDLNNNDKMAYNLGLQLCKKYDKPSVDKVLNQVTNIVPATFCAKMQPKVSNNISNAFKQAMDDYYSNPKTSEALLRMAHYELTYIYDFTSKKLLTKDISLIIWVLVHAPFLGRFLGATSVYINSVAYMAPLFLLNGWVGTRYSLEVGRSANGTLYFEYSQQEVYFRGQAPRDNKPWIQRISDATNIAVASQFCRLITNRVHYTSPNSSDYRLLDANKMEGFLKRLFSFEYNHQMRQRPAASANQPSIA